MVSTVSAVAGAFFGLVAILWAFYTFVVPPRFSRKRMEYELELSTPLLHESAQPDTNLIVKYGRRYRRHILEDPHIVRIRISNTGRREIRSGDFDQGTPLQLDMGVKIVALLRVICSLNDMPDPKASINERRLSLFPSLIPRHASIYLVILLDGPCGEITYKSPLTDVSFGERKESRLSGTGISPQRIVAWLAVAFIVWWIILEPNSAAHLVHNIGALLSQAAHGVSNFVASI
jgi:hypothetical protein